MRKKQFVAVIGGGECSVQEAELAEAVGRELARREVILVCGGLGGVTVSGRGFLLFFED